MFVILLKTLLFKKIVIRFINNIIMILIVKFCIFMSKIRDSQLIIVS